MSIVVRDPRGGYTKVAGAALSRLMEMSQDELRAHLSSFKKDEPKRPNFSQIEEFGNLQVRYERYVLRGRIVWTCTFYHEQRYGVDVVQIRVGGGAAICRPEDLTRFSDDMGKRIARGRALKCVYENREQLAREGVDPGVDWDTGRPEVAPEQLDLIGC